MSDNPDKIILVHCLYGASRSVTLVASYLLNFFELEFNVEDIIEFIGDRRLEIFPNPGFIKKLNIYRNSLIF